MGVSVEIVGTGPSAKHYTHNADITWTLNWALMDLYPDKQHVNIAFWMDDILRWGDGIRRATFYKFFMQPGWTEVYDRQRAAQKATQALAEGHTHHSECVCALCEAVENVKRAPWGEVVPQLPTIITSTVYPQLFPFMQAYPIAAVRTHFGARPFVPVLCSQVDYAIAYAIWRASLPPEHAEAMNITELHLHGVDMADRGMAYAWCMYWIARAQGAGIEVRINPFSMMAQKAQETFWPESGVTYEHGYAEHFDLGVLDPWFGGRLADYRQKQAQARAAERATPEGQAARGYAAIGSKADAERWIK